MKHPLTTYRFHRQQQGFTVIELMTVLTLLAVLAVLATPAWRTLVVRNAIRSMTNDYTLSVYFARTEAVRQNSPVTICPSNNGTNCTDSALEAGWIVFAGLPNAAAPTILQDTLPRARVRTAFSDNAVASRALTFLPNGQPAANFAGNTLRVCSTEADFANLSRDITITRAARINVVTPGVCNIP
ncbi:GspH/FimT family pseudopilin [Hydrogenophaga sp. SNF1]|uniref:GspH/FimT family pseudopilin n=1 Tax=Hydrogenophaga sp. SNF1 TaxID=3098762 RepID=UPI002ACBF726|nr:GspH/FimT family pseudopilin [Hydrogenophaga sp. SNF1]WQB85479.1 GspH/FimT family pseudopilin [Hydrogenophaga sp. SNF1]